MTEPLVIVGAGGFARETAELVRAIDRARPTWELLGFLDDDESMLGRRLVGLDVLGTSSWLDRHPEVRVVVCLGSPATVGLRRRVVERLDLHDDRYATLVHPAAVVADSVAVGGGTVIHASTVCTADIDIGRHVEMMPGVVLTHDDVVGDGATLGAGARLAGGVSVGEDAYIGAGASVRENLTVGRGALVGMGSIVTRSVPDFEVWAGSPARPLRTRGEVER